MFPIRNPQSRIQNLLFLSGLCVLCGVLPAGCSQQSRRDVTDAAERAFALVERARSANLKGRVKMIFTPTGSVAFGAGGASYTTESRVELELEGYVTGSGPRPGEFAEAGNITTESTENTENINREKIESDSR